MSSRSPRLASPADGATVQEFVRRAFAHYVPRLGMRPRPMDEDYGELASRGEVWVAGDPLIGALVLQEGGDHLWVDVIAVDPGQQGRGLGRELMAFAEKETRRRGNDEVRLLTNSLMTENVAFYARLGYEEYDRRDEYGTTRVYLRKRLVS